MKALLVQVIKATTRPAVSNLFGTRDRLHRRQFFHGLRWGYVFGMIQVHYNYYSLLFLLLSHQLHLRSSGIRSQILETPELNYREGNGTPLQYSCLENPREEPGRLQSMGSLRVRHNWATSLSLFTFIHWRRKWQPTPVFLPGESQGWGSLVGCRLWGRRVWHNWSDLAAEADRAKSQAGIGLNCRSGKTSKETKFSAKVSHLCWDQSPTREVVGPWFLEWEYLYQRT